MREAITASASSKGSDRSAVPKRTVIVMDACGSTVAWTRAAALLPSVVLTAPVSPWTTYASTPSFAVGDALGESNSSCVLDSFSQNTSIGAASTDDVTENQRSPSAGCALPIAAGVIQASVIHLQVAGVPTDATPDPVFTDTLVLDLSTVAPALADIPALALFRRGSPPNYPYI